MKPRSDEQVQPYAFPTQKHMIVTSHNDIRSSHKLRFHITEMHLVTQLEAEAHGKTAKPAHFFDRGLPSPRAESNSCCPTNAKSFTS